MKTAFFSLKFLYIKKKLYLCTRLKKKTMVNGFKERRMRIMETKDHEYYVSPEVAKLLEKAGFDWEVKSYRKGLNGIFETTSIPNNFNDGTLTDWISTPTLEVAQRWLREVKGIHICVKPNEASANCKYFVTVIVSDTKWGNVQDENKKTILFNTYEEAQEAGIKKTLEIILEKGE